MKKYCSLLIVAAIHLWSLRRVLYHLNDSTFDNSDRNTWIVLQLSESDKSTIGTR